MSTRWNYKVMSRSSRKWLSVTPKQIEEALAPLGSMGWELVSVTHIATTTYLYLKKEA